MSSLALTDWIFGKDDLDEEMPPQERLVTKPESSGVLGFFKTAAKLLIGTVAVMVAYKYLAGKLGIVVGAFSLDALKQGGEKIKNMAMDYFGFGPNSGIPASVKGPMNELKDGVGAAARHGVKNAVLSALPKSGIKGLLAGPIASLTKKAAWPVGAACYVGAIKDDVANHNAKGVAIETGSFLGGSWGAAMAGAARGFVTGPKNPWMTAATTIGGGIIGATMGEEGVKKMLGERDPNDPRPLTPLSPGAISHRKIGLDMPSPDA